MGSRDGLQRPRGRPGKSRHERQTGGSGSISGTGVTTGGSGVLVINVDGGANTLTLNAPITSTTTGGFTKVGAGTLIIAGLNAQTGVTRFLQEERGAHNRFVYDKAEDVADRKPFVDQVAALLGCGVRTVQRLFREYVGAGPKWLIGRRRVLAAAAAADGPDGPGWAELASALGFSDQAHLIRRFTESVGTTPTRYQR